jgi:hypothetical protein
MKTRKGFVSNSSSTSFCIYGASIKETSDVDIWEKAIEAGLIAYSRPEYNDDYMYVGRQWSGIKDDETGAAFKADTKKKIEEAFGSQECSTYEMGWYDG